MANLLARLRSRPPEARSGPWPSLSTNDYIQLVTTFTFNGVQYSTGSVDEPGRNFGELVSLVHRRHGLIAAAVTARAYVMSQMRFVWRNRRRDDQDFRGLDWSEALNILDRPDPGLLTRPQMLATHEAHVSYAGSAYCRRVSVNATRRVSDILVPLRPDLMDVVIGTFDNRPPEHPEQGRKIGYVYWPNGRHDDPLPLRTSQVMQWSPEPDPAAWWRGSSWVSSTVREIVVDMLGTKYVEAFFEKGAAPSFIVKPHERLTVDQIREFQEMFTQGYEGVDNAFKALWLGGGSDIVPIGSKLDELNLKDLQGGTESRIAVRSRIPAPILGIREGNAGGGMNANFYNPARRMWADSWFSPHAESLCAAYEAVLDRPPGRELWYDPADILLLQEDAKDQAEIDAKRAETLRALDSAGYGGDAAVNFLMTGNPAALLGAHDGNQSVQRLPELTAGGNSDE